MDRVLGFRYRVAHGHLDQIQPDGRRKLRGFTRLEGSRFGACPGAKTQTLFSILVKHRPQQQENP